MAGSGAVGRPVGSRPEDRRTIGRGSSVRRSRRGVRAGVVAIASRQVEEAVAGHASTCVLGTGATDRVYEPACAPSASLDQAGRPRTSRSSPNGAPSRTRGSAVPHRARWYAMVSISPNADLLVSGTSARGERNDPDGAVGAMWEDKDRCRSARRTRARRPPGARVVAGQAAAMVLGRLGSRALQIEAGRAEDVARPVSSLGDRASGDRGGRHRLHRGGGHLYEQPGRRVGRGPCRDGRRPAARRVGAEGYSHGEIAVVGAGRVATALWCCAAAGPVSRSRAGRRRPARRGSTAQRPWSRTGRGAGRAVVLIGTPTRRSA
jgi:hypothetical protein